MKKLKSFVSFCLPCAVFSVFFSSCGEKKSADEAVSTVEAVAEESGEIESANPEMDKRIEEIKEVQKEQVAEPVDEGDVADVAGFAKHLSKDTELFLNAQGVSEVIEAMRGSEMGEMLAGLVKKEGDDVDKAMDSTEFQEFLKVAGEEVFFSMGDGSADVIRATGDMYSIYYKMYYRMIGKFALAAMGDEEVMNDPEQMMGMMQEVFKPVWEEILEMDDYIVPAMYVGFKVSDESDRLRYTKLIQDTIAKANELNDFSPGMEIPFEDDGIEAYGGFKGVKINYSKWIKGMMGNLGQPELELMGMDAEYMEKFAEKFGDFKVTVLAGSYGDYVVIYLGDTSAGVKFMEEASESLLANEEMTFLKEYKGKEVVSMTYVSEEISRELGKVSTVMEDLAGGVNELLLETKVFGDTSHIQKLLKKMAVNSRKLKDITSPSRFGSVAYIEDGFKMDSFHGGDSVMYDLESERKLAKIAMREDAMLSSSWVANEVNGDLTIQSLDDFVHLVYEIAKLAVEHDVKDAEFQEFAGMFKMLDGQFSDDLLAIWNATRDGMQHGLGNEGAMVIDLKGKMPRVPDVPTVVLENGKIPRVAIGYDVVDRVKLADSWEVIDATSREIVTKLERLANEKINYRTPELAKKEGIDFWSYQLGITSYESNIALGINDKMMFFNTSPAFVESFVADYGAGGKRGGMDMKLRFAPVRDLAKDWMELICEHGDDIEPGFDQEEFEESKALMADVLKASEELDSLDFSIRKVNGEVRSFLHLNKRD